MALYRILKPLDTKHGRIDPGCIQALDWSGEKLDALERVGAISPVASPPLVELPGWETRAALLLPGIVTAEQFLLADNHFLATVLQLDEADMSAIKTSVTAWLSNPNAPPPPCGCA